MCRSRASNLPEILTVVTGGSYHRGYVFTLASGETVSQGTLDPLFQVRILARQPLG